MIFYENGPRGNHRKLPTSGEYLWHIRHPFVDNFSHNPWWTDRAGDVEIEAAIWEILRRHPLVEGFVTETLVDWEHDRESPDWSAKEGFLKENLDPYWQKRRKKLVENVRLWSFYNRPAGWDYDLLLGSSAWASWPELTKWDRTFWKREIQKMRSQHGFRGDRSYAVEVIPDVERLPRKTLMKLRSAASSKTNPNRFTELWQELRCRDSVDAFLNGHIVIAFDPHIADVAELTADRIRKAVLRWRRLFPKPKNSYNTGPIGRARIPDWLKIIETFEQAELSRTDKRKRDDQLFARYRRVIGAWKF